MTYKDCLVSINEFVTKSNELHKKYFRKNLQEIEYVNSRNYEPIDYVLENLSGGKK